MHWMGWQKILVDRGKYVHGLQQMMEFILPEVKLGVEIGLGWGVSAVTFLDKFPQADLISVDTYRELEAIKKLDLLYPVRFTYAHPDDLSHLRPIRCQWLYIDAGHEYEEVLKDLERYESMLEPGGVLAFDDYDAKGQWQYPGVKKAVDEFMAVNKGRYSNLFRPRTESETGPIFAVKRIEV